MVRVKQTPKHAVVIPQKCVMYVHKNPIRYVVHRRREYFLKDQKARDQARLVDYKKHVHRPPKDNTTAAKTAQTTHSGHNADGHRAYD